MDLPLMDPERVRFYIKYCFVHGRLNIQLDDVRILFITRYFGLVRVVDA
jgi:hypothetical protein